MKNKIRETGKSLMKKAVKALKERLGVLGARHGYHGIKACKDEKGLLVSTLSGKLEGFHSVSSSPESNKRCPRMAKCKGSICENCFSCRSIIPELGGYKTGLRENLKHNYEWLHREHVDAEFPVLNDLFSRIESHGEVDSVIQCVNYLKYVQHNPLTHFTAWTKWPNIWNEAIRKYGKPENLKMVYSSPMKNREVKYERIAKIYPWVDKVFTVYSPEYIVNHPEIESTINCGSRQCMACLLCYTDNDIRQIREIEK